MTEQYSLSKELGRGAFGVTYLATDSLGNEVAIKKINLKKLEISGVDLKSVIDEVITLQDLSQNTNSKYIVKCTDVFMDINEEKSQYFACIVTDYIRGTSLFEYIKKNAGKIQPEKLYNITLQLVEGLKDIHLAGYAHRDIKPENIMISDNGIIKYIDFGFACVRNCKVDDCKNVCQGLKGTLLYMPPEFFNDQHEDSLLCSQKHDIWSLGVVLYEMANGYNLFPFDIPINWNRSGVGQNIYYAPRYKSYYMSDGGFLNNFIDSLLINDWKQRPCVFAALNVANNILIL